MRSNSYWRGLPATSPQFRDIKMLQKTDSSQWDTISYLLRWLWPGVTVGEDAEGPGLLAHHCWTCKMYGNAGKKMKNETTIWSTILLWFLCKKTESRECALLNPWQETKARARAREKESYALLECITTGSCRRELGNVYQKNKEYGLGKQWDHVFKTPRKQRSESSLVG